MTLVMTIWLITISVPVGGCHILLFIFTLHVTNVVRTCFIEISVLCCLTLYLSLFHDLVVEGRNFGGSSPLIEPNTQFEGDLFEKE